MFLVINKEKLVSYIVSITTVMVLFIMASSIRPDENTMETGADMQNELTINKIEENENKASNQNNMYDKSKKSE